MIKNIHKHRVQCSDIMDGIDLLMGQQKADFVYSDPPWGQGNLKYWQTINKRHTGKAANEIDYDKFLTHFFDILRRYAKDICVVEYGIRWRDDVLKISSQSGFQSMGIFESLYGTTKLLPLDIHVLSKSGSVKIPESFSDSCLDLRGLPLVKYIMDSLAPTDAQIILDPMCGMGYTAQAAVDKGLTFYGNELNETRLEKTIKRLEKSL